MIDTLFIEDLALSGKRVLIRVDFNVPLTKTKEVSDDTRIKAALPTIQYCIKNKARVILMSHLGRPDGEVDLNYSMAPVAKYLEKIVGKPVGFIGDCVGTEVKARVAALKDGDVLVLENVRFHKEETKNVALFAQELAALADLYINDAFGTAHRAHASTAGVAAYVSQAAAGYLMRKEIDFLSKAIYAPEKPVVAILGGAKVSDKIPLIQNLIKKVNTILIGGGMAYTFLKAQGLPIGKSLLEEDQISLSKDLLQQAQQAGVSILLPIDHVVALECSQESLSSVVGKDGIQAEQRGLDIGPQTIELFGKAIKAAKTIIWNGPMGVFEISRFSEGTFAVARLIAQNTQALSIVGGGDSVSAVNKSGVADKISHISTGGGASLEFLEGKILPGIAALTPKPKRGCCCCH